MPELSIITVCFNEAARIALTCDSVVNQTFQDFEWLVIDGGSNDGTLNILKRYAGRMDYFVSEPDRGIYHAMNKGIAQARGTYLLFLNGGDYVYESTTLANVCASGQPFEKDMYYGDILFEQRQGRKHVSVDLTNPYATLLFRTPPHQALLIKRALFERYGGYDESLAIAADLDFILRVFVSSPSRTRHTSEHLPVIVSIYDNMHGFSIRHRDQTQLEKNVVRRKHYPAYYVCYAHGIHGLKRYARQARHGLNAWLTKCLPVRKRREP